MICVIRRRGVTKGNRFVSAVLQLLAAVAVVLLAGCSFQQKHSSLHHNAISLAEENLRNDGVAFISPSTVTGKEEDRQALAFIFADILKQERPDIRQMSLSATLGAINQAGIAADYNRMFADYQLTGIFDRKLLARVGEVTDSRYLVQLKLADFNQHSRGRFSLLGYRLFQTKHASIRVFCQVWDSRTGTIAWEGIEELNLAEDTGSEREISFTSVVEASARNLVALLPQRAALVQEGKTETLLVENKP